MTQIQQELRDKPLSLVTIPVPSDYYRDILVYSAIRKARETNKSVVVPEDIIFNYNQKNLLKYAEKPFDHAFDYIYSILEKEKKWSNTTNALMESLSAYEKVFLNEVINKLKDKNAHAFTKKAMKWYLNMNRYRLTEKEYKQAKEAFPEISGLF